MDLNLTPEHARFRQEVVDFLEEKIPERALGGFELYPDPSPEIAGFFTALADKGWMAPSLPPEYGGAGLGYMERFILSQEMAYRRAPDPRGNGPMLVGPALMHYGTEEQKARWLPGIARGTEIWCQGFSEPDAGSDLASLQCRAVRDGDEYVINGTKIWTSYSHFSDWMILLVRTDPEAPKHRGISVLFVDMKTPGIELRPIPTMMDIHHFNQVYMTDVRVPVDCRIGEENRGWYVTATTLDYERSSIGTQIAGYRRVHEDLLEWTHEHRSNLGSTYPVLRSELAELATQIAVGDVLAYRVVSMHEAGQVPNQEASMCKVFSTETGKRLYNLGARLLGLSSQLTPESKWTELQGRIERNLQWDIVMNIAGGSSEIQRNIVATRGLGLPRA